MIETIFLHIGPHKTGSTTIQQSLGKNSELLLKYGYLYPSFQLNGHIHYNHSTPLKNKFYWDYEGNEFALRGNYTRKEKQQNWNEAFDEQFKQQLNRFNGKYLIISGEDLCNFSVAQYLQLKSYLIAATNEKVNFRILMASRSPVDRFQSLVIELTKQGFTLKKENEITPILYKSFFKDLIDTLEQVFERSHIVVYRFEDAIRHPGGPAASFLQQIGVNEQLLHHFSNEQYNPALSYEAAIILSAINEKIPDREGEPFILSSGIRGHLIKLKGQKFVFSPELQRKIWQLANEDVNGICETFSLPGYMYREKEVPPISERWSELTLKHLRTIFSTASEELKLVLSEVLIQELSTHGKDFSKKQKDNMLNFIAGSTRYITMPGIIIIYNLLLKNMGYGRGISAVSYCFMDNMIWRISKKWVSFSINLRTLAEEKTPKHDIAAAAYKNKQLHFISTGRDPWFVIENPAPNRRIKCLSILLNVPENTVCQVFFTNTTNEAFSESKSLCYFVNQGTNKAYFEFPTLEKIVKIRIDPGRLAGAYCLQSVKMESK